MTARFHCDLGQPFSPLPHVWEHTVGSDHATMALRADWRRQLERSHRELGFGHVRFHGILSDDVGTLLCEQNRLVYSFFNADSIIDFLLSIGVRPFVELSFMPTTLASGPTTVFKYRGNVTPPRRLRDWETLIGKLVGHWVDRYGVAEVRRWFFEVWNEPNLASFWTGSQAGYFELYRHSVRAIKGIDERLPVGGPASAKTEWIPEFLRFCREQRLPADFVSTHHYPTDAFGSPGQDTESQLAESRRSVLPDQARRAQQEARGTPLYFTEWNTSSNSRDSLHDQPYAAACVVKTVLEVSRFVHGYSFWTFSDLFEENYLPSVPFHGGFGLLNLQGIPKPTYRAFALLRTIGTELRSVEGSHPTVDVWVVTGPDQLAVVCTNWALPRHRIEPARVTLTLTNAARPEQAVIERIDETHANPRRIWQRLGSPTYLTPSQERRLEAASAVDQHAQPFEYRSGSLTFRFGIPSQAVVVITADVSSKRRKRGRR